MQYRTYGEPMLPTLSRVLTLKGRNVRRVSIDTPLCEAVQLMMAQRIGSVAVVDGDTLVGILTERAAVAYVITNPPRSRSARVLDATERDFVSVPPDTPVREAVATMLARDLDHLPVTVDGALIGIVSLSDLARCAAHELEHDVSELHSYISGRCARHDSGWPLEVLYLNERDDDH